MKGKIGLQRGKPEIKRPGWNARNVWASISIDTVPSTLEMAKLLALAGLAGSGDGCANCKRLEQGAH
jgi:hypothetical protein